ncbi:MAG: helix-turn-helix transcriptional regulator [Colwellia sp.]
MLNLEIQTKLSTRGFAARVAEALGKSPSSISQVISGDAISKPIATSIAKILNCKIEDVFPHIPQYQPGYDVKALNAKKRATETAKIRDQLLVKE